MNKKYHTKENIIILLSILSNKWKFLIINELLNGELGFSDLKKRLECTSKELTLSTKDLIAQGFIVREILQEKPLRVEYYLTDIGFTLRSVINEMNSWGKDYKKLQLLLKSNN